MKAGGIELRAFLKWLKSQPTDNYFERDDGHGYQVIGFKTEKFTEDALEKWIAEASKWEKLFKAEEES